MRQPLFGGMFGIFGHGNVAGVAQALPAPAQGAGVVLIAGVALWRDDEMAGPRAKAICPAALPTTSVSSTALQLRHDGVCAVAEVHVRDDHRLGDATLGQLIERPVDQAFKITLRK